MPMLFCVVRTHSRPDQFRCREKKERLKKKRPLLNKVSSLNQRQLVGGNVEGIDIGGQAGVGLLGAVRAIK